MMLGIEPTGLISSKSLIWHLIKSDRFSIVEPLDKLMHVIIWSHIQTFKVIDLNLVSDIRVFEVTFFFCIGASSLGSVFRNTTEEESIVCVHNAVRAGINYIDTAPWYGHGKSETVLGKVGERTNHLME